jgi:hypothetical protein
LALKFTRLNLALPCNTSCVWGNNCDVLVNLSVVLQVSDCSNIGFEVVDWDSWAEETLIILIWDSVNILEFARSEGLWR